MATQIPGAQTRLLRYGTKVSRAAAVLPATGNQNLFTVTGGRIVLLSLVGQVTTATSATATNVKVTSVPTSGTAVDIAANALVTSKEVGSNLAVNGTIGTALSVNNAGAGLFATSPNFVVPPGVLRITTDATNTGAVKWDLFYVPLDDGAQVTAA